MYSVEIIIKSSYAAPPLILAVLQKEFKVNVRARSQDKGHACIFLLLERISILEKRTASYRILIKTNTDEGYEALDIPTYANIAV
jgi:hypothetical protein